MITARLAAALLVIAAGFAVLTALLMPNPGTHTTDRTPQPAPAHLVAASAPLGDGTGVSAELDADAAFLADLTDGAATDLDPATADGLIATAHRICDSSASRADWLATLTVPGPHALTDGEASKLVDTAQAAFCPTLSPWQTPRI
jgi:hypothetical protein